MNNTSPEQQAAADQQQLQKKRQQLERLSRLLDDAFTIPGLNIKIGWDAIIGLIPVVGDVIGAVLSFYLILQATQLKLGAFNLFRMLINIGIELLLGLVPVLGDFFDVTWRANRKNYDLIERHIEKQLQAIPSQEKQQACPQQLPANQCPGDARGYAWYISWCWDYSVPAPFTICFPSGRPATL